MRHRLSCLTVNILFFVVVAAQQNLDFVYNSLFFVYDKFIDVAFKVGPSTTFKYIVVNVHYLKKVTNDRSGLAISVTDKP